MPTRAPAPDAPPGAAISRVDHRISFFETDAMGVVHHANYVRFFEIARVHWLEEHDRPYTEYLADGLNFAVTRVEADYLRPARFDDRIRIATWLAWVRGASLRMEYQITAAGAVLVTGATEHAAVNADGRVRRIPREHRARLASRLGADR